MTIRGVFFDFGYVIEYPPADLDRRYLYLNWDGIPAITADPELVGWLRPGVSSAELESYLDREVYRVFVSHEQTDSIDPQSNELLLRTLHQVFDCPINQSLVDRLLTHLDTMRYVAIDRRAVDVVDELKRRRFRLSLVSNMMLPGKLLVARLQDAGMLAYFEDIWVSSDVGFIKPHPEIFRRALRASALSQDEVAFVGDTYRQDILGAKNVGLKTVWLNCRHEHQQMASTFPPDYEIESLDELLDIPLFRGNAGGGIAGS